jgi:hypothetical protein
VTFIHNVKDFKIMLKTINAIGLSVFSVAAITCAAVAPSQAQAEQVSGSTAANSQTGTISDSSTAIGGATGSATTNATATATNGTVEIVGGASSAGSVTTGGAATSTNSAGITAFTPGMYGTAQIKANSTTAPGSAAAQGFIDTVRVMNPMGANVTATPTANFSVLPIGTGVFQSQGTSSALGQFTGVK